LEKIKIGVVGAGYWGPNLIRNFDQIPLADLRMVCDLRQERLNHIHQLYPHVDTSQELNDLIASDIQAVAIATPVSTHHEIAIKLLQSGKHILVEKPLASSSSKAKQILSTAREMDKLVMVGHTFVFNPAVVALREIIASGDIGKVYYINCTRVNLGLYQPDINVLWDLAPHDISILHYILGMEPVTASARGGTYTKPGVFDVAYLSLFFPNGVIADLRLSWLDPCKIRRITIVGSKKMIVYDDIEPVDKIKIYDKGVDIQLYTDTYEDFQLAYRYGEAIPYPLKWEEPLRLECLHFLDCLHNGSSCRSGAQEGLKVVQVLEAAHESLLKRGIEQKVEYDNRF
jgi:predicted dehydrogenase